MEPDNIILGLFRFGSLWIKNMEGIKMEMKFTLRKERSSIIDPERNVYITISGDQRCLDMVKSKIEEIEGYEVI